MAEGIDFPGRNFTLKAPPGRTDVVDLHAFLQPDGPANVSCWRLSAEELAEVNRTGCIYLSVLLGRVFYPAFVGSESSVRALVSAYGSVWERGE